MDVGKLVGSKTVDAALGIVLSAVWGIFSFQHVNAFLQTREVAYLLFCALETFQAVFFLTRSRAESVSTDPKEWAVAMGGTLFPLFFRATETVLWSGGFLLVTIGAIFQFFALFSLNRSLGIVPAKRKIKTSGLYAIVRHPMYAGYIVTFSGYVLSNYSSLNLAIFISTLALMFLRMFFEEKHLSLDPLYQAYIGRVRWRLFPYIY